MRWNRWNQQPWVSFAVIVDFSLFSAFVSLHKSIFVSAEARSLKKDNE